MTYEPRDMAVTGFGGNNLNLKRFEENGKRLHIDGDRINAWDKLGLLHKCTTNLQKHILFCVN